MESQKFTQQEAKEISQKIGIDWSKCEFTLEQFRIGLEVESEHGPHGPGGKKTDVTGDDPLAYGKIAWAHLLEMSDYYTKLLEMEKSSSATSWFKRAQRDIRPIDDNVIEFYLDHNNLSELETILKKNNVPNWWVTAPSGKRIFLFEYGTIWVVEQNKNGAISYEKNSHEWVERASDRSYEYIPEEDFTETYWNSVGNGYKVYHATRPEYVDLIMKNGLEARSDTRGLKNRYMPPAVFTVTADDIDGMALSYGPSIIEIDLGLMKSDGYMPDVMEETPVSECNIKRSLAHLIGDESYETDCDSDYHSNTIAIMGDIPPKYLRVLQS